VGRPGDDGVEALTDARLEGQRRGRLAHLSLDLVGAVLGLGAVAGEGLQLVGAERDGAPRQGRLEQPLRDAIRSASALRQQEFVPPGPMNDPTDLERATNYDVEDQIVTHDEQAIAQALEARVPGLPAGLRKEREAADRLLDSVHEAPSGGGVIPGDVVEHVKEVLLSGGTSSQ
jgi:hypothetical protein